MGAVAAHSHMTDWPRIAFLFIESFFLPTSFLRYSYIFLCLILGPLGVYFFLNYVFRREKEGVAPSIGAFLGALYYLLNLGTLQHFYVPFEMFTTAYAFIPWLFYFALRFLREGKKKNLIIFVILTILSSPQAYAATLFYAYLGALTIFVLLYRFKRGFVLILITILLNLYWILPNFYSIKNQSQDVINSKINTLFSPEASFRSQDYSNFKDILIHKSFLFDWRAFDFQQGQFDDLMGVWNVHLASKYVLLTLYALAVFSALGFILSLFRRDKVGFSMFGVAIFALFFLAAGSFSSGIFKEALRMPFTKFSILLEFSLAFFFGYFFFKLGKIALLGLVAGSVALIFLVSPMFNGQLISPVVRRNLPNTYFELFGWFAGREGRIAALPLNTFWGWDYHSWKYEGSGFLTYGLKNPLLVRDFDRWSPYNEAFYTESAYALYANNNEAFARTLQKYQVRYLLLDESIINAGGSPEVLFIPQIKEMVSNLGYREAFKAGFLTVYDTGVNTDGFVSAPTQEFGDILPAVGPPRGDPIISEPFGEGRGFSEAYNCDLKKLGSVYKNGTTYRAEGNGVSCDFFDYPQLKHNQAYALRLRGENKEGRSLKIYLQNWKTNRMDLEELMPEGKFDQYFAVLPTKDNSAGYTLNLETRSFGRIASENVVEKIDFYALDYEFLSGKTDIENSLKIKNVKKYGTVIYKIAVEGDGLMQLGQGYEEGWVTYPKLEHVKVNSWANGWIVPSSIGYPTSSIYIFFWPQLLEWGGLILAGITLLTLVKVRLY